ncbi:MAG TPA: hypothetical protein VEK34_02945 [Methylocella sp.]|nr:hypothetical protein [Methylocella sp.]
MRRRKIFLPQLVQNSIKLSASASTVIALRMMKLAKGGSAAKRESKRMVDEKIKAAFDANVDAARALAAGKGAQIPTRTLALYQKRVQRNLQRLSKKR